MGWKTDQYSPDPAIVDRVILEAVCPTLVKLHLEAKEEPVATVAVWTGDTNDGERVVGPGGFLAGATPQPRGQIRIRFRRTINPERTLFHAQAVYTRFAERTGYSGFIIEGSCKTMDDQVVVHTTSVVHRYNNPTWVSPS